MSGTTNQTRRVWPVVLIVVLILAIVAAVAIYFATRPAGTTDPTSSPTPSASASSSAPTTDSAPTGCLGGPKRDSAMLISADGAAPQSSDGATEVAAAYVRWIQRYPYPSATEAAAISKQVMADPSFTDDLTAYLAAKPDLSGGIVPKGTDYFMSTVVGVWNLESSSSDRAVVSIGSAFVVNDALSPTLRSSITITLAWQDNSWKVVDADGTRTTEELFSIGHAFTGGC